MSDLLNQRSLKGARRLVRFRLGLVALSALFACFGVAAVLMPAAESLRQFDKESVRVIVWGELSVWAVFTPWFIANCVRSVGRLDDVLPLPNYARRLSKRFGLASALFLLPVTATGAFLDLRRGRRLLPLFEVDNPLDWAVFWLASAVVAAALVPVLGYLQDTTARTAFEKLASAAAPQYLRTVEAIEDPALYQLYWFKNKPETRERFRLPNVPVYFMIPPSPGGYSVEIRAVPAEPAEQPAASPLAKAAALRGLDWSGFARWRIRHEEDRYLWSHDWDDAVALTGVKPCGSTIIVDCRRTKYSEFLVREKSADLKVEGTLIRDLLEERTWNDTFDLSHIELSSGHYSYCASVNTLYTTKDDFLVLQRRNTGLQTGGGNLGASVAGSLNWKDLHRSRRPETAALYGIRRETREELSIKDHEIEDDLPCTGLGLNLRHGRDPNCYFWGQLKLGYAEISDRRRALLWDRELGRDAWEWDHLLFVPVESVARDGSIGGHFDSLLAGARHLRAALFALAQNTRFQELQRRAAASRARPPALAPNRPSTVA